MAMVVSLNGIVVGRLVKTQSAGLQFYYGQDWLNRAGARPISLSLPLSSEAHTGDKVYNFFDNLLPDNPIIRQKIQSRFQVGTSHAYDLLEAVGNDCVGAIQLSSAEPKNVKAIDAIPLSTQAVETLLNGYLDAPLGMLKGDDDFRISLAGAQEKTALLKLGDQWAKPLGPTPTTHILKLPIGRLPTVNIDLTDSCENEFICLELARAFGLPVANSEVVTFGAQKVLCVERFDRRYAADKSWIMRLPQEDFCQAMGLSSAQKYQSDGGPSIKQCMALLAASTNKADRAVFFKSQIFFWLLAAIDGHGKNFSVFLEAGNRYRMTPLYDILSAYPVMRKGGLQRQKIKMAMSLKGKNTHWKWQTIQPRHFLSTAEHIGFDANEVKNILVEMFDSIDSAVSTVERLIPESFPGYIAQAIFTGVKQQKKKLAAFHI